MTKKQTTTYPDVLEETQTPIHIIGINRSICSSADCRIALFTSCIFIILYVNALFLVNNNFFVIINSSPFAFSVAPRSIDVFVIIMTFINFHYHFSILAIFTVSAGLLLIALQNVIIYLFTSDR